jgi:copper homeostasis protein CutC
MLIEICAYCLADALAAQAAGAHRIELCADASVGGITPSAGIIQTARELLQIALFVMIRPRGGDFVYSDTEFAAMKRDIEFCRKLKVDGVVLGLLDSEHNVDRLRTTELVAAARPMESTFHRAFDLTADPAQALEDVIASGCSRILTSGHRPSKVPPTSRSCSSLRTDASPSCPAPAYAAPNSLTLLARRAQPNFILRPALSHPRQKHPTQSNRVSANSIPSMPKRSSDYVR